MTDINQISTKIEAEPDRLDEYTDDLRSILDSGDTEARRDVAELLHDISIPGRSVLARHTDLLEMALHDDDPTVRRFGAVAAATASGAHPEAITEFVDALVEAYPTLRYGSDKAAVVRALGIIGDETSTSLHQYDGWFAELLRDGDGIVPSEVAGNIGNLVVDAPHEYPAMVQALTDALGTGDTETRSHAVIVVALTAQEDLAALSKPERALDAVQQLRSYRTLDTDMVNKAAGMIQAAMNKHESSRSE